MSRFGPGKSNINLNTISTLNIALDIAWQWGIKKGRQNVKKRLRDRITLIKQ